MLYANNQDDRVPTYRFLTDNPTHIMTAEEFQNMEFTPNRQEDSIYYCSLVNYNGIGWASAYYWELAIRLTPTELLPYAGYSIVAVVWYHYDGSSQDGRAIIYDQGTPTNPGPIITAEAYNEGIIGWQRVDLSNPVSISGDTELWCSIEVNQTVVASYPGGVDSGPAIDGKGDWVYIHDPPWAEIQSYGLDYNWQILAIVERLGVEENLHPKDNLFIMGFASTIPNPTKDYAPITYTTPRSGRVSLKVYDAAGRLIRILVNRTNEPAGTKTVYWDGKDDNHQSLANGVYFLNLKFEDSIATRKLILMR